MPAYRSQAEADIRREVVAQLRMMLPGCRIIHEINVESFGNRIDVLAVGDTRLIAVEIKSEKDKLDRLKDQVAAMRLVTHEVFVAIHERFLAPLGNEGQYGVTPPHDAHPAVTWVYPRSPRNGHVECGEHWALRDRWKKPMRGLPPGAIGMLWLKELQGVCRDLGERSVSKLTMAECVDRIRWAMTGDQITKMICATLCARQCVEADEPIASRILDPTP